MIRGILPTIESIEQAEPNAPLLNTIYGAPIAFPVVAVIDTGVDWTHPALAGKVWVNPREKPNRLDDDGNGYRDDLRGWNFVGGNNLPLDDNGHGTHCAGIVAQHGAAAMALKALDRGAMGYAQNVAKAIVYACNNGARVISLSMGDYQRDATIADAVKVAQRSGVLVVAAAGNDGSDNRTMPVYPACLPGVLSVMALDGRALWTRSNRGGQIAAPGRGIRSTLPGGMWGNYSGTSMAAPFVAAIAARLFTLRPYWSGEQVAARIIASADKLAGGALALNEARALAVEPSLPRPHWLD